MQGQTIKFTSRNRIGLCPHHNTPVRMIGQHEAHYKYRRNARLVHFWNTLGQTVHNINYNYYKVDNNISVLTFLKIVWGASWSWWYGSWTYNYLCNQCLSQLTLWVRIPFRRGVLDTTLCDKVCLWLAACWWFSPVSSINKTDIHDITKILLKVALNTINITLVVNPTTMQ